ncbi:MAG TPA: DCC1-like thiol-disulfide oxidoreductase family protein [Holophagaceae bacterium]|nr:DCC1-like thiol-disulfide oxidoreductase family protein [Holophagaceae bacterium]
MSDLLFYDGHCGLCHRSVAFALARDRRARFRFAPLQGTTFAKLVPPSQQAALPDSLVMWTAGGELLTRSDAVLRLLRGLGGVWRLLAALGRLVPRRWRDRAYDRIAATRKEKYGTREELCPVVPPELKDRFDP